MSHRAETTPVTGEDALDPALAGRLTRIAVAVVAALAVAVVVSVAGAGGADAPGGRLGGDLPAFFGAGRIAADADWESLYDASAQIAAQGDLWDDDGDYLYFAYPPQVAAGYRLLVPLGYRTAYLVHTFAMALAVLGAVVVARPVFRWMQRLPLVVPFAVALSFYPLLRAVLGGQNSALTLLLLALVLRLEHEGAHTSAGLTAALLLYKPQFGIPLALLIVAGRRWRMLGGWAAGAAGVYLTGALALGGGWPADWWDQATAFASLNLDANGPNFVSIPGFVANVFGETAGTTTLVVVGLAAGLAAALVWWALPGEPALRIAVATAVIVAVAPQSLFYEAGVLLLAVAALARNGREGVRWIGVLWVAGLVHVAGSIFDASPLVAVVAVVTGATLARALPLARARLSPV